jgi:CheY-like chemotaxis protein
MGLEVMRLAKNDPVILEKTRSTMERQAEQMVRLIDDLLDVSRITQGKLQLCHTRVNLLETVQAAIEAARPLINEAGHELVATLPRQEIILEADPHRLAQVFANLLNNAAKYTPQGGRILLTVEQHGPEAIVTVSDSGVGIPAEMQGRIFEMYEQIDRPAANGYTGLGIGLTLVKRLVEMHGGSVGVHSDGAGTGSAFIVRLPIPAAPARDAQRCLGEEDPRPETHRILVVDDNKAAATILEMMLTTMGNVVRTAHDGLEAIRAADEFRPDIVLMDIGMPHLNGHDAARRLREQPWGEPMLLVALTGWGQEEDKQRTREAGFDHHFTKPVDPAALRQFLSAHRPHSRQPGKPA